MINSDNTNDSTTGSVNEKKSTTVLLPKATVAEVNRVIRKASDIFETYKRVPVQKRILFLEKIAEELSISGPTLISTTNKETSLPQKRLEGERERTINQINMFVNLLKEGSWVNAIIDPAQPNRLPFPKPDTRQMQIPLGVVGVFGASNFPYAFSVAGGDTISALAAGCPVVFKAHSGHPLTSELVGQCILKAARSAEMPEGVFSLLHGSGQEIGTAIVKHPLVKAIAFTGSFLGGKSIYDTAVKRPEPIPVYAEMGSVNPVFILPGILHNNSLNVAKTLADSNILGVGQFCTNPGIIIKTKSKDIDQFVNDYTMYASNLQGGKMLTERIYQAFSEGIDFLQNHKEVKLLCKGKGENENWAIPHVFEVSGESFLQNKDLCEEVFGPSATIVIADDKEQLNEIARSFMGQLTVSVWAAESDFEEYSELFQLLENKAGRLMVNNVPTGVEVTHAMVHGGPFPATTNSKATSVGSRSIYRFTRPFCYQNFPQELLPDALKNNNSLQIWRLVDGNLIKDNLKENK
ncbi:MAG: aldehyde dehydrogenase (NADP(+)) [Ginsengibacter sp.]